MGRLDLAQLKEKWQMEHSWGGESLACSEGGLAWWKPWQGALRGLLRETRRGSLDKGLFHCSLEWMDPDEKRQFMVLKHLLS